MSLSELASFAISGSAATAVAALITDRAVPPDNIGTKPTKPATSAGNGFVFFLAYYVAAAAGPRLAGRHSPDDTTPTSTRSAATQAFFIGATAAVCTRLLGPRDGVPLQHQDKAENEAHPLNGDNGTEAPQPPSPPPPSQPTRQHRWSREALEDDFVLALDPGLTFCIHEILARLVAQRQWRRHASRQQRASGLSAAVTTFLLAAASKVIATGITYPLYRAATAAEAARRRRTLTDDGGNGESRILAMLWKTVRHPGGLRALYDGWLRNVAAAAFGHGLTMALQRALYGLVLRLVFSVTGALRSRLAVTTRPRKAMHVDTHEAPRSSPQMTTDTVDVFTDEREQVTKAVETWLESTTGSSDIAPSRNGRDATRLLPSPESTSFPRTVVSSHQMWIGSRPTSQEGRPPPSPQDGALVRYEATRHAETTDSRAREAPPEAPQRSADAAPRSAPVDGDIDIDGDDDGAGSVIFNMISKSPRVFKR